MRYYLYSMLSVTIVFLLAMTLASCGYREQISLTGLPGANGADGMNGLDGQDGADGEMGPRGETGQPGPQGIQGLQGIPGLNGSNGANGTNGQDGEDGEDGSSQVAQILNFPANSCTRITNTSTYTKVNGGNFKLYTSSSCSSSSSFGELSQGESMWVSASALAVWEDDALRVIYFN